TVRPAAVLAFAGLLLAGCKKDLEKPYSVLGDDQFPTLLNNSLTGVATKYAPGEVIPIELQFAQQGAPIQEIRVYQRIEPNSDSTVVQTLPASRAAFSRIRNADTLVVNFVMPSGPNKTRVRFSAQVVSANGLTKTRAVNFRLAEATPTIRINSTTNVTAPANAPLVSGDVVRYALVLNENGISAYPERPAAPPPATAVLFNNLDSLVTYVRVGTTAERRFARQRLPTAGAQTGAATTLNLDLALPTGSSGQTVTFRFEAKSRYAGTPNFRASSATSAPITLGTPTALAPARTVTLTYTGTTGGDLAAYDLTTFTPVPVAGPVTSKDIAITSTASNAVRLQTLNPTTGTPTPTPTRFVRLATGGAAAYTNATLNSIRQAYLTATPANQVTQLDNVVVGDVLVARVRGLQQYAILNVTGINRTSVTDVVVTLAVKAL
ncbi:MAG TPA: hypothetical protein VK364_02960, partial [Hymenobacter sp.]|nr:hypothetical protein [Hymenobacter sp.]